MNISREFNVHMCPQRSLQTTRESDPIFETPAEISVKAPLSALRSPRDTRRDTKLTLSPTKKNHAICFRSHKSLQYHPQGIFLEKRVCDTFCTLCDIRFCQSINKRTKENVNHYFKSFIEIPHRIYLSQNQQVDRNYS